ncbi:MAG TPA: thioesterase domain-containing protein [Bryobacteraceae bacterium]|nr:thioesterase domain-containing protein [Bryobacteraceae bacterium]
MLHACSIDEDRLALAEAGRQPPTPERLAEHLWATRERLKAFGIRTGDSVVSLLPGGPDEDTARMAVEASLARFVPLTDGGSRRKFISRLSEIRAKLLLLHPGPHPSREAAFSLGIPVADVLRHFEAGVFTLEAAVPSPSVHERRASDAVPLVLIAPGAAYSRLSAHLDPEHPVIGITPPTLEHMPPPHTIEHIAAHCVRILQRCRAHGPYALAGWQAEGLVALEMARLIEEEGEKVSFVAMLDATDLFCPPRSLVRRAVSRVVRRKLTPSCEPLAGALRRYRPYPWCGKIIHLAPAGQPEPRPAWFEWDRIAPHGLTSHFAPAEMLTEPNVRIVAAILATEMERAAAG